MVMKTDTKNKIKEKYPLINYITEKKRSIPYNIQRNLNSSRAKKKILRKLNKGVKINVIFFEGRKQIWFFDKLFELFSSDNEFDVKIVAIPFASDGHEEMVHFMDELADMLHGKGINCIKGYDKKTNTFLDIKELYDPDIIFFTQAYDPHTVPMFYMNRFDESLNYFMSYALHIVANGGMFAERSQYLAYKDYYESDLLYDVAQSYRMDHVPNFSSLGSPKLDYYFEEHELIKSPWKYNGSYKRIIWAPHFSFKETGNTYIVASFLEICDFMVDIAKKYQDRIEFIFKPHPLLRHELERYWNIEKINAYYAIWDNMPNTQFFNGSYPELFVTSDAMIFDSISFILEYFMTGKPAIYTVCQNAKLAFNRFGEEIYRHVYHTKELQSDIISFIENVVIAGNDSRKQERERFIFEHLRRSVNLSSSQKIYMDVKNDINKLMKRE